MTSSIYSGYRCTNETERCERCNKPRYPGVEHRVGSSTFCPECGYPREVYGRGPVTIAWAALDQAYDQAYRDGYNTGHMHGRTKAENELYRLRALARNVIEWRQRYQEAHAKRPYGGPTANALALYELAAAELARVVMETAK